MTTNHSPDATDKPPAGWRLKTGIGLLIIGLLAPLGVPILAMSDLSMGMKATLGGILLAGVPEILTLMAIAILGKRGFAFVKGKLMSML